MMVSRLGSQAIEALVGDKAARRLANKLQGGKSGQKGFRYETVFGAHRIARLLRKLIDTGEDAFVEWQSNGFVDDFTVRRDAKSSFKAYQLKNSPSAAWVPDIVEDFANQHIVSTEEGYADIRLRLVCSNLTTAKALASGVPAAISAYSGAFYFPWDEAILSVVIANPWMAQDFGYLSRHASPNNAQVAEVLRLILGAWECEAPSAMVSEIMTKVRSTSPTMIRTLQSDEEAVAQLDPLFKAIIEAFPDFEYHIERGFFHWSAFGGSTKGTYSQDCFSNQFRGLQGHIINMRPISVDQIESLLQ